MSDDLLRKYITEVLNDIDQNIVRKDPRGTGNVILRKLVTFVKPSSVFGPGDDVDADLNKDGTISVDDVEKWKPDFRKPKSKKKKVHRLI